MTMLAIDTATDFAGVAFYDANGVLGEQSWRSHRGQTAQLVPVLQGLMGYLHLKPGDLSALAVSSGPGSFNSLRVGLGTAKAMAVALQVPLYGISSLDALAWMHAAVSSRLTVWATLAAGRSRLAVAAYKTGGKGTPDWRRTTEYRNVDIAEFCTLITTPAYLCGELTAAMQREIAERVPDLVTFASPAASFRRPSYLAELAWRRKQEGDLGDNIADLQAIYLASPSPSTARRG